MLFLKLGTVSSILNDLRLTKRSFLEDFGYYDTTTSSWNISTGIQNAVTMAILAGCVSASMLSGPIGTFLGRRWGLFITAIVSVLGVLLQITSANLGTLIVGRVFSGSESIHLRDV